MGKTVHIRNRNGSLYIETYLYGRQIRRTLGLRLTGDAKHDKKVLRLAEVIRSRREMQLACMEWGIPDMTGSDRMLTIYMEENYRKSRNCTLGRCIHYVRMFKNGSVRLGQVSPRWIEEFQEWLRTESGLSQGSACLYSCALRHQLRLAVRDRLIASNPAETVRNISMPESRKQPLTLAQLKKLSLIPISGKLGGEVRRAFLFSCFTALRISDLKTLTYSMIFTRSDGKRWICKRQKKTGTEVYIPLHDTAISILNEQDISNSDSNFVFPLLAATKANTDQYLRKWGLKAGIDHVSWHTARHTMATIALENGAELRTVSELLGHSDISTTMRYAKATDSLKKSAVDAIPAL